jgi:hypothetical protein
MKPVTASERLSRRVFRVFDKLEGMYRNMVGQLASLREAPTADHSDTQLTK